MTVNLSFRHFLKIIFVVFSLYLTGDAVSRWEGFRFYASFSEFLPSLSLAFILWSIVSVFASAAGWILLRLLEKLCNRFGIRIDIEHILLYAVTVILSGGLAWKAKKIIWPYTQTGPMVKLAVFLCIAAASVLVVRLLYERSRNVVNIVLERITPLVWLFVTFLLLSIPLVSYHAWIKENNLPQNNTNASGTVQDGIGPNIILLTFDALAAREMEAYGYDKSTTPFINKWAQRAFRFEKAVASSNFTTPAVASLMTGKRVWSHRTYHIGGTKPVDGATESLPFILKGKGYFNIAIVVNPFASVDILGMSGSFDIAPPATEFGGSNSLFGWKFGIIDEMLYRAFGGKIRQHNWILKNDFIFSKFLNAVSRNISSTTVPPEAAFDRLLDILDQKCPQPFFVWIHVFPPHDPYLPPEPFAGMFSSSEKLRTYKEQEELIEKSYGYLFEHKPFPEEMRSSVALMRNYYDEFITYSDDRFNGFIRALNERELENTILILSADHGESFDHGYFTHGGPFLYEQVTHIPLIIKEPGQKTGETIEGLVEQIDIPATILDYAGIPVPEWMEGRSLIPLMRGRSLPPRPVYSMNFEMNRSRKHLIAKGSVAIWDGEYKLIHYLDKNESMLFNVKRDPDEQFDLIYEKSGEAARLRKLVLNEIEKANRSISGDINAQK